MRILTKGLMVLFLFLICTIGLSTSEVFATNYNLIGDIPTEWVYGEKLGSFTGVYFFLTPIMGSYDNHIGMGANNAGLWNFQINSGNGTVGDPVNLNLRFDYEFSASYSGYNMDNFQFNYISLDQIYTVKWWDQSVDPFKNFQLGYQVGYSSNDMTNYDLAGTFNFSVPVTTGHLYALNADTGYFNIYMVGDGLINEDLDTRVTLSAFSKLGLIDYSVSSVPEPSTLLLLGSGLIGLVGFGRRKFRK